MTQASPLKAALDQEVDTIKTLALLGISPVALGVTLIVFGKQPASSGSPAVETISRLCGSGAVITGVLVLPTVLITAPLALLGIGLTVLSAPFRILYRVVRNSKNKEGP